MSEESAKKLLKEPLDLIEQVLVRHEATLLDFIKQQHDELRELRKWQHEAETLLSRFISLSSQPDEPSWAENATKSVYLLKEIKQ